MEAREEAIQQIHFLMQKFKLSINDLIPVETLPVQSKSGQSIRQFFAFLGGIFILSGIGVYTSQHWAEMNSAARVIITLGVGITLFIFAVAAADNKRYEKLLTPLFLLAALFETTGMFVTIHEFFPTGGDWHLVGMFVFGTMLAQQLLIFFRYLRSSLLFLSLLFGFVFFVTLFDYLNIPDKYMEMTLGLSLLLIAYGLDKTRHKIITPCWYLAGSTLLLVGLFMLVRQSYIEAVFLGATIVIIYMSTIVRSRMLLFSGTIFLIYYIGYFTERHFAKSIGWPLSLVLFGLMLIVISMAAIRIGKSIK